MLLLLVTAAFAQDAAPSLVVIRGDTCEVVAGSGPETDAMRRECARREALAKAEQKARTDAAQASGPLDIASERVSVAYRTPIAVPLTAPSQRDYRRTCTVQVLADESGVPLQVEANSCPAMLREITWQSVLDWRFAAEDADWGGPVRFAYVVDYGVEPTKRD